MIGIVHPFRTQMHVWRTVWILFSVLIAITNASCFAIDTLWISPNKNFLNQWRWQTFTEMDGLTGALITDIYAAPDSSILFATLRGAVRYDGYHWTTYAFESDTLDAVVNCISTDSKGNLWFGTPNGVLHYVDGRWERISVTDGLPAANVRDILLDSRGRLWFACSSKPDSANEGFGGVGGLDSSGLHKYGADEGLTAKQVYAIKEDFYGNILCATNEGPAIFKNGQWSFFKAKKQQLIVNSTDLCVDDAGSIWVINAYGIALYKDGLWQNQYEFLKERRTGSQEKDFHKQNWTIERAGNGHLWASYGDYLLHFDGKEWHSYSIFDLNLEAVHGLAVAYDGSLWIGCGTQASRFDPTESRIAMWQFEEDLTLSCQDKTGAIWCASKYGAIRFDGHHWVLYGQSDSLKGEVKDIFEDSKGTIWAAGTHNHSAVLHRFDGNVWHQVAGANELFGRVATEVYVSNKGEIWICVWDDFPNIGAGICRFDKEKWQHITKQDGLASDRCIGVAEGKTGDVWIGSFDGRVSRYDGWNWYSHAKDLGLDGRHLVKPFKGPDGYIWFAQGDANGLIRANGKNYKKFDNSTGFLGSRVWDMGAGLDGTISVVTNNGVYRYDGQSWLPIALTNQLLSVPHWKYQRIIPASDNSFWLGKLDKRAGKYCIIRYKKDQFHPLCEIAHAQSRIKHKGNLLVKLRGVDKWKSKTEGDELQYSWRLDDRPWSPFSFKPEIYLVQVPMGLHTLKVRARDADLNIGLIPTEFQFRVSSPFWLSPWFYLPLVLLCILLISQTRRVVRRDRTLREMNKLLENLVERRTKALRLSEEQYRYLVENSVEGIFILQDGELKFMNKRIPEILGHPVNYLEQKGIIDVIIPQQQAEIQSALDLIMRDNKKHLRREYKVETQIGKEIDVEITGSRIEFRGQPAFQGVIRDVTERNQLQGQLLAAQRMEIMGSLAGGIAHDFNNLLTTIMGYVSLLLMKIPVGEKYYKELNQVQEASVKASELTQQLLSFSQKGKHNAQLVNLNDTVAETVKLIRRTFPVRIEINMDQSSNQILNLIDPMQIRQVLMELCVNARDAITQNGRITISTQRVKLNQEFCRLHRDVNPGMYSKLTVADTGNGMSSKVQKRMFEPFFTTKAMSSGMGLAMAFDIVKNHGGTFMVESELGKGTTVDIYLPAAKAKQKAPEVHILSDTYDGTILVADDEEMIVNVAKNILEDLGYQVDTATNINETIEVFLKDPDKYDLVLLDVEMPLQNGTQIYLAMKEIRPDVKVVFCSGASIDPVTKQMWDDGVLGFLKKPFKTETLAETIWKAMTKIRKKGRKSQTQK